MKKKRNIFKRFSYEFLGLLIFTVVSALLLFVNRFAGIAALAGAAVYAIVTFILTNTEKHRIARDRDVSGLSPTIADLIEKIDSPVMLVNETNNIVWCNDEFLSLSEVSDMHIGAGTKKLFNGKVSFANMSTAFEEYTDYIQVETSGSIYLVRVFPLEYGEQKLFGSIWYRHDEYQALRKDLDDSSVRVAYIVIDNTNEVSEEIQETRHFGAAAVNQLLNEWAKQYDAILTEYERDKYIMQFENRYMQEMIDSKFDILDRVVEVSKIESPVPITISIGVSLSKGTLLEKRESAQAMLRTALQRGGAMVAVRTEDGEAFYGGRTKAVQRQTKIRSRLCKDMLCEQIPNSSNVVIMGHTRPDYDSIASNIGISKLVQSFGIDYRIVADKNDANFKKVVESILDFPEYESVFVASEYAQELIKTNTLVIITDASNPELFASYEVYKNAKKVVVIDHHARNGQLGPQVLPLSNIDPTASSASELVCEILELALQPGALRQEEAQILLLGILLDTQFFARDTGTRTYSACIYLKNAGADVGVAKSFFKSDLAQYKEISKISRNMILYRERFIISTYVENIKPENKVIASKAADNFVSIEGINASFVLYSLDNGINLSARSDGSVNVITIAEKLGGGGHFQSAGALIRRVQEDGTFGEVVFDIEEAVKILQSAIDDYIGIPKEGK